MSYLIVDIIARTPAGWLADKWGRKTVLLWGIILSMVGPDLPFAGNMVIICAVSEKEAINEWKIPGIVDSHNNSYNGPWLLVWRPYRAGAHGHVHTDEDPCSDLHRDADYRAQPDGYSAADLDGDADRAAADAHTYTDGNADAGAADEYAHASSPCAYGDLKASNPHKYPAAGV